MKKLFLIGVVLSSIGIILGLIHDSLWLLLLYIGLVLIATKDTTNSNEFCIKFAEYYFNQIVKNETESTTKELLNKFKNEYYG